MSPAEARRRLPPRRERDKILEKQGNACLYCGNTFGSVVYKNGVGEPLEVRWDHMVPFCYGQNNKADNFCAACHVCNASKSSKMFNTVEEASDYIKRRWAKRGYSKTTPEV